MFNFPLLITVIVNGRWSSLLRRLEVGLNLVTCAALAWTVLDGPVFSARASDRTVRFFLVLIVALTLINVGIKLFRSVRPAPSHRIQARR